MRPGAAVGKLGFLAAVVWLAGCGGSPGRELADAARSAGSWAATAAAAGEGWHAGRLPAVYARQTAALAGEELRRLGREAGELGPPAAALSRRLAAAAGLATGLAAAVEREDRAGARARARRLGAARRELAALGGAR